MFDLDTSDIRRIAVSAIGALIVSAGCVIGAVGPARAASPTPTTAISVTVAPATGLVGAVRY